MRLLLAAAALALALAPVPARAIDVGESGSTYAIAEKDFIEEAQERAAKADWARLNREAQERLDGFRPADWATLPRAERDRKFTVDMRYTLEFDVTDQKGNVLYPKGYSFNPLDFEGFPDTIVVIDGTSPAQVAWFKRRFDRRDDVVLLVSSGNLKSLRELGKGVRTTPYYLKALIRDRLRLERVPSVVRQSGASMEVEEVHVAESR